MKNTPIKLSIVLAAAAITFTSLPACEAKRTTPAPKAEAAASQEKVREPAVAGQFYPGDPRDLEGTVDHLLLAASPPEAKGQLTALIVPHAGYEYSGQVAAFGYKELTAEEIDTVIIVGNSHRERFDGVSIIPEGFFKTPLGKVEIDSELAHALMKETDIIHYKESPHVAEHSIEVQLPFLQRMIKHFKIVPLLFGNNFDRDYITLARAISKSIKGKNVLLVASSDLSHYPSYNDAKSSDEKVVKAILFGDVQNVERTVRDLESRNIPNAVTFACGIDAIKTVMEVERELGANEIRLIRAANSGDVTQDRNRVVGYAAIGFFGERRGSLLSKAEQRQLLKIARTSVESAIRSSKVPEFKISDPALNENLGAFVTIKEHGNLRGCIGCFSPSDRPLYKAVSQMALSAALEDRRFPPVGKDELGALRYEISVLSPLKKIDSPREITLGKHGVKIIRGFNAGVFLPQVATETKWDMEKFMGELCSQKAGLSPDCWKQKGTDIYTFTAQVFAE
ncbi:MAG: AmmeMemoRadiSam system protein B [Pseudomonadota bacterium]